MSNAEHETGNAGNGPSLSSLLLNKRKSLLGDKHRKNQISTKSKISADVRAAEIW